jgi:hypothetical protein
MPLVVQRAKIGAGGDIARLQLQPQAERLNHAAPHFIFQRIITEQPQMPRPAARRDARGDRDHAPLRADRGPGVQVGRAGRFQRREKILFRVARSPKPSSTTRTILALVLTVNFA